jgi:Protein of unknown function (DUF2909)
MIFKVFILVMLVLVLISLGKALFHLSGTREDDGKKMFTALAWRIGLSVALFLLLIVAYYSGWIEPQQITPGHSQ